MRCHSIALLIALSTSCAVAQMTTVVNVPGTTITGATVTIAETMSTVVVEPNGSTMPVPANTETGGAAASSGGAGTTGGAAGTTGTGGNGIVPAVTSTGGVPPSAVSSIQESVSSAVSSVGSQAASALSSASAKAASSAASVASAAASSHASGSGSAASGSASPSGSSAASTLRVGESLWALIVAIGFGAAVVF